MKKRLFGFLLVLCTVMIGLRILSGSPAGNGKVPLPTSKLLLQPVPGDPQSTNSFPAGTALSPDGRYLALLNDGYGTWESGYRQSVGLLEIASNKLTDFPDPRLERRARQTYFYGLTFSLDGKKLYVSVGSMTDPNGKDTGDTGGGIAVYSVVEGKIKPADFIRFPASNRAAAPKTAPAEEEGEAPSPGVTVPFPTGLSVFQRQGKEMLLVADNLSDSADVVDVSTKRVVQQVDLSVYPVVPGSYPLATVVTRDGSTGYVSLWNASRVAEIDLASGKLRRMIELHVPASQELAGSHPTALLMSPDQSRLYVALANTDEVGVVERKGGEVFYLSAKLPDQQYGGNFPIGLAVTPDGQRLFVANASSDAVAVFDNPQPNAKARGFIPTEWYPTALALENGELFI